MLPRWFPIHLSRISYRPAPSSFPSRSGRVAHARPQSAQGWYPELFATPRPVERKAGHQHRGWALFFNALDGAEGGGPVVAEISCAAAPSTASVAFVKERLNGEDIGRDLLLPWRTP